MSANLDLSFLARRARITGSTIIADGTARDPAIFPPAAPGLCGVVEPLLGVRCPASVLAVAYPAEVVVDRHDRFDDIVIGVAVDRAAGVAIDHPPGGAPLVSADEGSCSLDLGLRALGLATPSPDLSIESFVDGLWLDRVLELALSANLGDPPRWRDISRLHPLGHGRVHAPEELRRIRSDLPGGWESLRRSIATSGRRGPLMYAPLAAWCDTGAFARRMLASTVSATDVIADLDEILRCHDAALVRLALQPILRTT